MHTVPLWLGGGGQRVNLIEAPSGVFRTPARAPSGTGLAGMETSFIREHFRNAALGRSVETYKQWGRIYRLSESPAALNASAEILLPLRLLKPKAGSPYWCRAGHPAARIRSGPMGGPL